MTRPHLPHLKAEKGKGNGRSSQPAVHIVDSLDLNVIIVYAKIQ